MDMGLSLPLPARDGLGQPRLPGPSLLGGFPPLEAGLGGPVSLSAETSRAVQKRALSSSACVCLCRSRQPSRFGIITGRP